MPRLASRLLGRMAGILSPDWQQVYGHPICFVETFIYPERFRGMSYDATNWIVLGRTTGRGKNAPPKQPTQRGARYERRCQGRDRGARRVAMVVTGAPHRPPRAAAPR